MPRTPLNQIASIVATSTLGVVFLTAAASKTIDPAVTLSAFVYMLPTEPGYAATLTRVLIAMEFVLAGLLLFRVAPLRTILAAFAVLVVFTGWLVYLKLWDIRIGCGCGINAKWLSPGDERSAAIIRNTTLLMVAGIGIAASWRTHALASSVHHHETVETTRTQETLT